MIYNTIQISFNNYTKIIDSLIYEIENRGIDEDAFVLLTELSNFYMKFSHRIVLKILFAILNQAETSIKEIYNDIPDLEYMRKELIKQINQDFNKAKKRNFSKKQQRDIDDILLSLKFLRSLTDTLKNIILSILKYQSDIINEKEFRAKYQDFKKDLRNDRILFEENYQNIKTRINEYQTNYPTQNNKIQISID